MLNHFKFLELTSHRAFKKAKKFVAETTQTDPPPEEKIAEVVFSSTLTLFISYLVEIYFSVEDKESLCFFDVVIYLIAEIALYIAIFFVIRKLCRKIRERFAKHIYNTKIHSPDTSPIKNKELVDDFDNIAFDNLLVAIECLKQIETKQSSLDNRETDPLSLIELEIIKFYLHESIYYLRVAVDITLDLTTPDRQRACLNIRGNTRGVDIYRLINAQQIMQHLVVSIRNVYKFLYIDDISIDKLKFLIDTKITRLENDICDISKICEQAILDISRVY